MENADLPKLKTVQSTCRKPEEVYVVTDLQLTC